MALIAVLALMSLMIELLGAWWLEIYKCI